MQAALLFLLIGSVSQADDFELRARAAVAVAAASQELLFSYGHGTAELAPEVKLTENGVPEKVRKHRLVYFTQPSCVPCKGQKKELDKLVATGWKVGIASSNHIQVIDLVDEPAVAAGFRVTSTPTMLLVEEGKETWRHSGPLNCADVAKAFGKELESQKKRLKAAVKGMAKAVGKAVGNIGKDYYWHRGIGSASPWPGGLAAHLQQKHRINTAGMSLQQMIRIHDRSHGW